MPCLPFVFHNRIRVLNHLKYRSTVCRLNLTLLGPIIDTDRAYVLDSECRLIRNSLRRKGLRAHAATDPVFRLCGPLPCPLIDPLTFLDSVEGISDDDEWTPLIMCMSRCGVVHPGEGSILLVVPPFCCGVVGLTPCVCVLPRCFCTG